MNREFFISIPTILEVKQSDQWIRVFCLCYDDEINNSPECFNRDKGDARFHLIDCMKIPWKNYFKKRYIKKVLIMANNLHKIDELSITDKEKLTTQAASLNRSFSSIDTEEVLTSSSYWEG